MLYSLATRRVEGLRGRADKTEWEFLGLFKDIREAYSMYYGYVNPNEDYTHYCSCVIYEVIGFMKMGEKIIAGAGNGL